jgi:hypothetical protein
MNSTVEAFFNAGEEISISRTFFEIKQHYSFTENTLHVFVEDEDDFEFYRKSLEKIYSEYSIISYPKKGKKNVLDSYDELDWSKYEKSRILFFVDKDYEDILGYSSRKDFNVFVTKYYSIENYLASKEIFKYTLEAIFKIKHRVIVDDLVNRFDSSFDVFKNHMILLTSIILIFRKNNEHLVLDKLKMDDFFKFKGLEIHPIKYRNAEVLLNLRRSEIEPFAKSLVKEHKIIQTFKKTEADISKIKYHIIRDNIKKIKEIEDGRCFIRGKFHLWFFIESVNNVHRLSDRINTDIKRINDQLTENEKKPNINTSISINHDNIFDILPMKIEPHNDVLLFLDYNKQQING